MLSPLLVGPIIREKCLCAKCISNTTRVCLKALEKHFFLLGVALEDSQRPLGIRDGYGITTLQALPGQGPERAGGPALALPVP